MVEPTFSLTPEPPRAPEEQLKLMALHLRSDRECLLIVATPDAEAEQALAEEVRLRLADEVAVEERTFSSASVEGMSLSQHLMTLPTPSGKAVVFAFGLDDLPPDDRDTAINALNWGRERLRWVSYSIVLWVRSKTPGELGNRAPDFFSWRSDVFEFDVPINSAERQQALARLRLFAPATMDDLRQRYLAYVMRTYQWLDFRGLLQLRNVVRLPLDEVFVPLHATTASDYDLPFDRLPTAESDHDIEWQRYASRPVERRVVFTDALHQHRYLLVLGDPGSGKSTLLRFLALTFSQGQACVQEKLSLSEDRVPILVSLSAFADVLKAQPDISLAAFLPSYFTGQGLPDFSPLFDDALHSSRAIVLLDGLDEMLTYDDRATVSHAVAEFANLYPTTRIVVTSRIAGYAPGMLPASFATLTVAPFDDSAIRQFANQWSLAFEAIGLSPSVELPPDAHHRATRRADNLTTAATSHPGIRRLATNPLLLTLLALIHYQGVRLPNRRADLYRLCVEAFAETWNLARSLTGRPIDLRLGERRLDEEYVVGILAPIALWLHETKPTGMVEREELEARIAALFVENEGVGSDDATSLACDFVALAREQLGLLVERAPDAFSFLHLSVQEYLAARFLSERQDGFDRLKPHLHHPRWREVVLLTAGCLRGDYATAFVQNILDAHSPFESLLSRALVLGQRPRASFIHRIIGQGRQAGLKIKTILLSIMDILLAADCIGDGVSMPVTLSQRICDTLFEFWMHPPFYAPSRDIASVFLHMNGGVVGDDVRDFLIHILKKPTADRMVRRTTVVTLQQGWKGNSEVKSEMISLLQNTNEDRWVREQIAKSLAKGWTEDFEIKAILLDFLQDQNEHYVVLSGIASALIQGWAGDPEIRDRMLNFLQDASANNWIRWGAVVASGDSWAGDIEIKTHLLGLLQNSNEEPLMRWESAHALGQGWADDPEVKSALLQILRDANEDINFRAQTACALGHYLADDSEVRTTLLRILQDSSEQEVIRMQILQELGQSGLGTLTFLTTLINVLHNKNQMMYGRIAAAHALGRAGQDKEEAMSALLKAVNEPELREAALASIWQLLSHTRASETFGHAATSAIYPPTKHFSLKVADNFNTSVRRYTYGTLDR
ncbi:MAG: hypothetical protein ETSY2_24115 [Candidatus Entotheonella gemina]|uniref:NACHT domain-containing protein n=1 Tax=Candidatus Entotheonella gemina TaxID=1429439 RepID=W4M5M9_9BACT|nr:MAG: hypothetical protein ETSY2_24115 [Candidatus Entotheonella gemina]